MQLNCASDLTPRHKKAKYSYKNSNSYKKTKYVCRDMLIVQIVIDKTVIINVKVAWLKFILHDHMISFHQSKYAAGI